MIAPQGESPPKGLEIGEKLLWLFEEPHMMSPSDEVQKLQSFRTWMLVFHVLLQGTHSATLDIAYRTVEFSNSLEQ